MSNKNRITIRDQSSSASCQASDLKGGWSEPFMMKFTKIKGSLVEGTYYDPRYGELKGIFNRDHIRFAQKD